LTGVEWMNGRPAYPSHRPASHRKPAWNRGFRDRQGCPLPTLAPAENRLAEAREDSVLPSSRLNSSHRAVEPTIPRPSLRGLFIKRQA
jgi:hypothetical protein